MSRNYIDIVFDRPPGPESPGFIEVEDERGHSVTVGEWVVRPDGTYALRIDNFLSVDELLSTQHLLQAAMGNPTGLGEPGCKENLLHVVVETIEALREINFKPWKTGVKEVDRKALATELTDILQFWANAALAMELTPDDLTEALRAKWQVNYQRIRANDVKSAQHAKQDPMVINKICPQCGARGGKHEENCPQNFDADALRDGVLKRVTP